MASALLRPPYAPAPQRRRLQVSLTLLPEVVRAVDVLAARERRTRSAWVEGYLAEVARERGLLPPQDPARVEHALNRACWPGDEEP